MLPQLAVHLWSVHDLARVDLAAALDLVVEAGYRRVETMGFGELSVARAGQLMAERGLQVCAAHVDFEAPAALLEQYAELGVSTLAWSLEPAEFATGDRLLAGVERINRAAARAANFGMHWAYHNHFAEFTARHRHDGRWLDGWSVLQAELDPAVVLELDAYWPRVVGVDPAVAAAAASRPIELVHLKDGPATGMGDRMTPPHADTPGLRGVLASSPRWAVVELDRVAGSMAEALAQARGSLLAAGLVQDPV